MAISEAGSIGGDEGIWEAIKVVIPLSVGAGVYQNIIPTVVKGVSEEFVFEPAVGGVVEGEIEDWRDWVGSWSKGIVTVSGVIPMVMYGVWCQVENYHTLPSFLSFHSLLPHITTLPNFPLSPRDVFKLAVVASSSIGCVIGLGSEISHYLPPPTSDVVEKDEMRKVDVAAAVLPALAAANFMTFTGETEGAINMIGASSTIAVPMLYGLMPFLVSQSIATVAKEE